MKIDSIQSSKNLNFKNLYVEKGLNGIQNSIAYNVSKKLSAISKTGVPYMKEIENKGFDVLAIQTELNNPDEIRLCVIKNMESCKTSDGEYDYLDAKPILETGMHFSAENFYKVFEQKTAPKLKAAKELFTKIFN